MFDNVVVGIDNYEAGRDALELAKQLVAPDGDMLLVFVEVVMRAPGPDTDPQWQLDERRRALERLASVRDANADAQLLTVQAGSVARGLHEAVRRHGDLLVIGASRRDEFERTFVGDDTRQVLQDAPSAVAVAPTGYATRLPSLDTIGVGYDGSPASEQALTVASTLARERGGERSAFEAVADPMSVPTSTGCATGSRVAARPSDWRTALRARCSCSAREPGTRLERASGVRSRPRARRSAALPRRSGSRATRSPPRRRAWTASI